MTGHIVKVIETFRKISREYTGTEPNFNQSIETVARIDSAMIRAELKILPSMFYKWFEVMIIRDDLLPALKKNQRHGISEKFPRNAGNQTDR